MEKIQALEEEVTHEEFEDEDPNLVITDVGELLVIRRALYVQEAHCDQSLID